MRLHQTPKFFTAKEKFSKMKRKVTKNEKIFLNYISDKGLISKTRKELIQPNRKHKQINSLIKNKQCTRRVIFPKKIYIWPTDTWKEPHIRKMPRQIFKQIVGKMLFVFSACLYINGTRELNSQVENIINLTLTSHHSQNWMSNELQV